MSVGGVIGGAIGFVATGFNPAGAQMGYALGAALEAATKVTPAPAPGDLSTQTSNYGAAVPEIFGPMRSTGQVLWSPKLKVRKVTQGKGGGQKVNKYYWSGVVSFGWADPRIAPNGYKLHRVWINKKLVCDMRTDAFSYEAAVASRKLFRYCEWHGGGATQQPPVIQQEHDGINSVPGYRFHARLDVREMPLSDDVGFGDLGGRPPVIEAEISINGASGGDPVGRRILAVTGAMPGRLSPDDGLDMPFWRGGYAAMYQQRGARVLRADTTEYYGLLVSADGSNGFPWLRGAGNAVRMGDGTELQAPHAAPGGAYIGYALPVCATDGDTRHAIGGDDRPTLALYRHSGAPERYITLPAGMLSALTLDAYCAYALVYVHAEGRLRVLRYVHAPTMTATVPPGYADEIDIAGPSGVSWYAAIYVQSPGIVWVLAVPNAGAALRLYRCDAAGGERVLSPVHTINALQNLPTRGQCMYCDGETLLWLQQDGIYAATLKSGASGATTVGSVIGALCVRAGVTLADIDTTDLDAVPLRGFGLARRTSARASIEGLAAHTPLMGVESGGALHFRARTASDPATLLPEDDLLEPLQVQRTQDRDLPQEITVQYMSLDSDYQPGAQSARMQTSAATSQQSLPLGVAMTDTEAAQVAARSLTMAYVGRETYTLATTLAHAYLEPGDVVQLTSAGRTYLMRLTNREEGQGQIRWAAVAENPLVYAQHAVASPIAYTPQSIGLAGPSDLVELSNIPPLRDADTQPGVYIAYHGYGSAWGGARLQSLDGQDIPGTATPYRMDTGVLQGPISAQPDTLPDFVNSVDIVFDERDEVDWGVVTIAEVLGSGVQCVVIDAEVVGVLRAELVGVGRYRCTGFLRGLRGSSIQAHATGRQVHVLSGAVMPYAYTADSIGTSETVRAVSVGQDPAQASTVQLEHTAGTAHMLSPCAIAGGRLPGGDLQIQWQRRSRFDQVLRANGEASLDDPFERYEVEILSAGGSVKRVISTDAPSAIYTAAQQVADFGGTATAPTVRVYQLSTYAGRGRPATKSLYVPA